MLTPTEQFLAYMKEYPALYAPSSAPFWDDEHISKLMLEAHLNPTWDAASRRHEFTDASARWICKMCGVKSGMRLLDFGCGPGLYASRFSDAGFMVTGVDFSRRSIAYARENAQQSGRSIEYIYKNYLEIEYADEFDAATLIYCDFGVLSPQSRATLLKKTYAALRPGGFFILDCHTTAHGEAFIESEQTSYLESGFFSAEPHVLVERSRRYKSTGESNLCGSPSLCCCETDNILNQNIVLTKDMCECYNIWNQIFTDKSLKKELSAAGFTAIEFYDDVSGSPFTGRAMDMCAVARKG